MRFNGGNTETLFQGIAASFQISGKLSLNQIRVCSLAVLLAGFGSTWSDATHRLSARPAGLTMVDWFC
jgi:hypothetical protein